MNDTINLFPQLVYSPFSLIYLFTLKYFLHIKFVVLSRKKLFFFSAEFLVLFSKSHVQNYIITRLNIM